MQNDIDLDLFCREVIHADMVHLKKTPTRNVVLDVHHGNEEVVLEESEEIDRLGRRGRIEEVFGEQLRVRSWCSSRAKVSFVGLVKGVARE